MADWTSTRRPVGWNDEKRGQMTEFERRVNAGETLTQFDRGNLSALDYSAIHAYEKQRVELLLRRARFEARS